MRAYAVLTAGAVALSLSACSWIDDKKVEYKSAGKLPSLEVPPDLTRPGRDDRYLVPETPSGPGGTTTLSTYNSERAAAPRPGSTEILPDNNKVRVQRSGNQRWLVVSETPEKLWPIMKEFWQTNGFVLRTELPEAGVMETDWAENRAKIPNDGIRSVLSRVLDTIYSTGERDKFRTRLERGTTPNTTEIYISHRGMVEKLVNRPQSTDSTLWEPRPPDPELEAEFLQRLVVRLGADEASAKSQVAASAPVVERAKLIGGGGADSAGALELDEPFDRAWRRVGLALDRVGFTVEDRDRTKGYYFVRYIDPKEDEPVKKDSILSKLAFWRSDTRAVGIDQFRVLVKGAPDSSQIQVLNKDGAADSSSTAKRILSLLHEQLK